MSLERTPKARTWTQLLFGVFMPMATFILALLFDAVPMATGTAALFLPNFTLPILFYWTVHTPRAVPLIIVAILGFATDTLHDTPFGLHALAFIVLVLGAKSQSRHLAGLGLLFNWAFFALATAIYGLMLYLITLLAQPGLLGDFFGLAGPAALKGVQLVLTTIVAYIPFHLALTALQRLFLYNNEGPYSS